MLQNLPQLSVVVAFLVAFVASASRVFAISKPFWARFPAWFQMLAPQIALALGALGQGLAGGVKSVTDLTVVFVGAAAFLLPGMPSNRSSAAVPSSSNPPLPPQSKPPTFGGMGPMGGMLMLCLVVSLSGCAWFKGSFWPNVSHCAPSPASLVADVADILSAGEDYESALEQLALVKGKDLVLCAAEAFVNSIGKKVGASPEEMAARARGKAFLAKHPVRQ